MISAIDTVFLKFWFIAKLKTQLYEDARVVNFMMQTYNLCCPSFAHTSCTSFVYNIKENVLGIIYFVFCSCYRRTTIVKEDSIEVEAQKRSVVYILNHLAIFCNHHLDFILYNSY